MKEIISLRKPREKHFLNEDGTITLYAYDHDIHYLKNGKYQEIDNTLIEKEDCFQNKDNPFKIYLYKNSDDNKILKVEKDHYFLEYSIENSNLNKTAFKIENSIIYENILESMDLKYVIRENKLKDYITLKNENANLQNLIFKIHSNLDLVLEKDQIKLKEKENLIYVIEKPTLMDKNNKFYDIHYKLEKTEEEYYLSFTVEEPILLNQDLYPFTIDPTITNNPTGNVFDTYIYPGDTNINRNDSDILKVGVDENNQIYRTLLKFDLPIIGTGSEVVNATAVLISHASNYTYENERGKEININVHRVLSNWSEDTANWDTMNNQYESRIESYFRAQRSDKGLEDITLKESTFDITNLVKSWYAGYSNNGLLLKFDRENNTNGYKEQSFYSKNNSIASDKVADPKPYLIISYRNINGLENYMTYQTIQHQNGKSYINYLTGNLINTFDLNKTIAGKSPIELSLIYNTNDVVLNNNYGLTGGYKFNYYQTIKEIKIENQDYLEYLDMDGTLHYFYKQDENYIDEDGMNLTVTLENLKYVMTDKNGNKMYFQKSNGTYYLVEVVDISNNQTTITYNSNNQINTITDTDNQSINISYSSTKITITSDYMISYINLTNGLISSIDTKLGVTVFEYNSNKIIIKIKNPNGLKIKFDYYENIPYRIKKVSELGLNDGIGNTLEFVYEFLITRVIDQKGRVNTYTFNNQGNTIGITNLKSSDDFTDSYGIYKVFETYNEQSKNRLLLSTNASKYTNNLFSNHSFEDTTITSYDKATVVNNNARSGDYCLKITEETKLPLPKVLTSGDYTFSGYFKNSSSMIISLIDQANNVINQKDNILTNEDYNRYSLTGNLDSTINYYIKIKPLNNSIVYLDDVQFEPGVVANYINIVENSNFEQGFTKWVRNGTDIEGNDISNFDEIITLSNGVKAYKRTNHLNTSISMSQTFNYAGKKNETYKLSFWYKNEGIISNDGDYRGNLAFVSFGYLDDIPGHPFICYLNTHATEWQYFQMTFTTIADYNRVNLDFISQDEVNNLYITNITLTKDLEINSFVYDDKGNLKSSKDRSNEVSKFNYDKNNQLTSVFSPKGNHFDFEYDNINTSKVLQGISNNGISNEIEYDKFQNPIKTKIINHSVNLNSNSYFNIRLKGTKKYLFADKINYKINVKEPECNIDAWTLENVENNKYFYIKHLNYYLSCSQIDKSSCILKNDKEEAQSFELIVNNNGSYIFKKSGDTNECLTYESERIYFSELNYENENTHQFYLEDIFKQEYIETKSEYTLDGKYVTKIIDPLNKETLYDIDDKTGLKTKIKDPNGNVIQYYYDNKERVTEISKEDKKILYNYNLNDLVSKIIKNNIEYSWIYDEFLREKEIKLGNQNIITNYYEPNNGNLIKTIFGNQQYLEYTYDEMDRICTLSKDGKILYDFIYNNENDLVKVNSKNENYEYFYDFAKRLSRFSYNNYTVDYDYNINSNITLKKYNVYDQNNSILYDYDDDDNILNLTYDNHKLNYTFDDLGRLVTKNLDNNLYTNYTYYSNGNKQSFILKSMQIQKDLYEYIYDNGYNITHIFKNGILIHKYEYDKFDCLVKEDNFINNTTIYYSYDASGNMILRKYCDLNSDNLLYQDKFDYLNSVWEDQLTKFNDISISYDEIGNPIKIGNAVLTWKCGRELSNYQDDKVSVSYTYNKDGVRTKKIVNNVETEYFIENNLVILEKCNDNVIYYMRDNNGSLIGFKFNNDIYYYQKNMQKDIIGIYNSQYELITSYEYDSWGKILKITDENGTIINDLNHIAHINPFRYRSYYYDCETGLYYLKSRFYNPLWCRFLNADTYINTDTGIMGYNMYIYCNNDPIKRRDSDGQFGFFGLVVACVSVITAIAVVANNIEQNKKAINEIKEVQEKNSTKPKVTNNEFKNTLKNNVNKITSDISPSSSIISKSLKFKDLVCSGCEYDLKKQEPWKDNTIYYDGHWMEAQDIGNYNYGYMGAALKIPFFELMFGASYAQVKAKTHNINFCLSTSLCDDPRDSYYIKLGYRAYKQNQEE